MPLCATVKVQMEERQEYDPFCSHKGFVDISRSEKRGVVRCLKDDDHVEVYGCLNSYMSSPIVTSVLEKCMYIFQR